MANQGHLEVFISYAHEDEALKVELVKHLALLRKQGFITVWHDRDISAGTDWIHEINTRLDSAHIILLLISASFLASDYCYSVEMKQAMRQHESGLARVIPIILRSVDWKGAPFSNLQALPTNARPVTGRGWRNRDEAFTNIAQGIRSLMEAFRPQEAMEQSQRRLNSLSTPMNSLKPVERMDEQKVSDEKGHPSFFNSGLHLRYKQKLRTETSGMVCEVEEYLGSGGQGEIYRVNVMGKAAALKWYFPHNATLQQRNHLQVLIERGAPSKNFLWPIELVSTSAFDFGYLMSLREERYKPIADAIKRHIRTSFRTLASVGFELAQSFFLLHAEGLCYHDISFGHVTFDPSSGEVLLHDTDSIVLSGSVSGVLGTPRFMAPELLRGEVSPSIYTDLFSLSVLFFYLFMFSHPLEGRREYDLIIPDSSAMMKIYGTDPLFIFDPNDHSNEPIKGYQDDALIRWPIYPQFLRGLFTRAFTQGLKDPIRGRVREDEWRAAMVRLRDAIYYCPRCYQENFYDVEVLKKNNDQPAPCWNCKEALQLPWHLRVNDHIIMLNQDTRLFPHHINNRKKYDFSQPVAQVIGHPQNPNLWGLKNLSQEKWIMVMSDGSRQDVGVGRSASLAVGTKLLFGNTVGEIRL